MKHERSLREELKEWLASSSLVVIAGIGNPIRRDDFVGVRVIELLRPRVSSKVHLIECETVPESFMDEIIEVVPTHVLLVDSANIGLEPGMAHLYEVEEVASVPTISTHTMPLRVFCEYVTSLTRAKVGLLLIQPRCMDFGEGLSDDVEKAAVEIAETLAELLS